MSPNRAWLALKAVVLALAMLSLVMDIAWAKVLRPHAPMYKVEFTPILILLCDVEVTVGDLLKPSSCNHWRHSRAVIRKPLSA